MTIHLNHTGYPTSWWLFSQGVFAQFPENSHQPDFEYKKLLKLWIAA